MCMSKEILKYFKDITQKHHNIKTDFEDTCCKYVCLSLSLCMLPLPKHFSSLASQL